MSFLRPCFVITATLLVWCCFLYPAAVTAGAQLLFSERANGSLVVRDGKVRGSEIIGQSVQDWGAHPQYFWGRASASSNDASTGITYSSGSNYGPTNPALLDEVKARIDVLRASGVSGAVPVDLVTKSASGLDPHISVAAAELQVARVAAARKIATDVVSALVRTYTESSSLGFLGEPRVNVLLLNLALDDTAPYSAN